MKGFCDCPDCYYTMDAEHNFGSTCNICNTRINWVNNGEPLQKLADTHKAYNMSEAGVLSKCCASSIINLNGTPHCRLCYREVGSSEPKTTQLLSTKDTWKKEGKCPTCGELGRFSNFAYVCSTHGIYT